jgi:chromosome partitioning protein
MRPVERWAEAETGVRDFLDEARDTFDLCLIDCPPNLHLCSWAALVASDFLIVPLSPEDYGAQGIIDVQESVALVQAGPNPALRLLGYLITMHDKRLGIHIAYETLLRELYGPAVFTTPFPLAKDFKEAVASRLPISHYKPKSAAAKAAVAVASELQERVEHEIQDARRVA